MKGIYLERIGTGLGTGQSRALLAGRPRASATFWQPYTRTPCLFHGKDHWEGFRDYETIEELLGIDAPEEEGIFQFQ